MDTPVFIDGQFVNAKLLNEAAQKLMGSIGAVGSFLHTPGLLNADSLVFTPSGLTIGISAPDPFAVLFGSGLVADAHGTVNGADTTSYSVNMAPLVPSSGSVTAFVLASYTTVGDDLVTVVGPPPGHPDYNPNFNPFQFYSGQKSTLRITATTVAPDNETTFELCRVTLSQGQGSIQPNQINANHIYASAVLSPTGVQAGTYAGVTLTVGKDGRITNIVAVPYGPLAAGNDWTGPNTFEQEVTAKAGITSTGFDAGAGGGQFRATSTNYGMIIRNDDSNVYFLQTPRGQPNGSFSPLRPFSWNLSTGQVSIDGTGAGTTFGGPATVVDPSTTGLTVQGLGSNGANIKLFASAGSKFLRAISNSLEVVNNAYSAVILTLDDVGNLSVPGQMSAAAFSTGGTVSAGTVNATNINSTNLVTTPNINVSSTANTGYLNASQTVTGNILRAVYGARNSGDPNRGVILNDFVHSWPGVNFGWSVLPDNLTLQVVTAQCARGIRAPARTLVTLPATFTGGIVASICGYNGNDPPIDPGSICCQPYSNNQVQVSTDFSQGVGDLGIVVWALGFGPLA